MNSLQATILAELERARAVATLTEEENAAWIAAERRELRRQRLEKIRGVLTNDDFDRVLHERLDSRASQLVRTVIDQAANGEARILWLCGGPGTGKTVAMAQAIAARDGVLILGPDLVDAFTRKDAEARHTQHVLKTTMTLVLDDLGTLDPAVEQSAVFQVINARRARGMLTLITGNQTKSQVEALDPRIVSRVEQLGAIVELGGSDMRRRQR